MGCSNNSYQYESDAETLFSVGRRFLNGDCVEKDVAKAKEILTKAAELGHPMASKLNASRRKSRLPMPTT